MRDGLGRCFNISQYRPDSCRRKRGQPEAFTGEGNEIASRAHPVESMKYEGKKEELRIRLRTRLRRDISEKWRVRVTSR